MQWLGPCEPELNIVNVPLSDPCERWEGFLFGFRFAVVAFRFLFVCCFVDRVFCLLLFETDPMESWLSQSSLYRTGWAWNHRYRPSSPFESRDVCATTAGPDFGVLLMGWMGEWSWALHTYVPPHRSWPYYTTVVGAHLRPSLGFATGFAPWWPMPMDILPYLLWVHKPCSIKRSGAPCPLNSTMLHPPRYHTVTYKCVCFELEQVTPYRVWVRRWLLFFREIGEEMDIFAMNNFQHVKG